MKRFDDDSIKNARIKIDYRGENKKVEFTYPDKKNQVENSMYLPLFLFIFLILYIAGIVLGVGSIPFNCSVANGKSCSIFELNNYISTNGFEKSIQIENKTYYETKEGNRLKVINNKIYYRKEDSLFDIMNILIYPLMIFAILWGLPYLLDKLLKKALKREYPKLQALFKKKKYMTFDNKSEFRNQKYYEVPYFSNVNLNYKASEEFSKLLEFIEIEEYKFIEKTKKGRVKNEFIWYARFYYKSKPNTGKLEVEFI